MLRIKLRYDDVDAMVQRFAPNVGKSGLFLPTKSLQAVGAEIKFELRLADDTPVLVGLGRVKAAKPPDAANPKAAFGMAIELMRVTRESREVILKMLERRKALGLPEIAIPHAADIDAARRGEVDTSTKDAASTAVPAHASAVDSAPVLAAQITDSGPVMTAPRRNSGPLAVAKVHTVTPLEPEPPRKKRSPVSEVIERASGPIAAAVHVPGLDDDVDVGAVLARARALAGGNLDAELEALRELSAAPVEIGIEAASAELAKQLGGVAVRRDRSAKWAPPPETIAAPPAIAAKVEPALEPEPKPALAPAAAPKPGSESGSESGSGSGSGSEPAPAPAPEPESEPEVVELRDSTPMLDVDPDPEEEDAEAAHEVDADQIADEIHQLGDSDVEEVEHTQIGALPVDPSAFDQHVFVTEPGVTADLERSLERHLADAEAEADDLGMAPPAEELGEEELDDFEILAEADAEDADLLTSHGEQEASGVSIAAAAPHELPGFEPEPAGLEPEPPAYEPEPVALEAEPAALEAEPAALEPKPAAFEPQPEAAAPPLEEGANAHIPARIRAQQRRVSGQHVIVRTTPLVQSAPEPYEPEPYEPEPYEPEPVPVPAPYIRPRGRHVSEAPPERPSLADFAARLDLSDEFDAAPEASEPAPPSGRHAIMSELDEALGELDPRSVSAGHALAAFEEDPDEPASFDPAGTDYESESGFTIAGNISVDSIDFGAPLIEQPPGFPPLHAFDSSDVIAPEMIANLPRRTKPQAAGADSYDLETALEALDVDLDDLSIPVADVPPAPATRQPRAARVVPKRADTDIPIDFDDFDED